MPGARCTRGLVCKMHKGKRTRAYRFSGGNPAFPARWFYGLFRALLGDRAFCHRRLRIFTRKLDASAEASGPHDFAVRLAPPVLRRHCVHRIPHPTFVTTRTPLLRDGMGRKVPLIWG
jgi:hypothetical protein